MKTPVRIHFIGILLFFCFYFSNILSQEPVWKFAKTGSEESLQEMMVDTSGNLYLASYFYTTTFEYQDKAVNGLSGSETNNLVIFKTEPTGKPLWMHSIRGSNIGASVRFDNLAISERGELVVSFAVSNTTKVIIDNFSANTNPSNDNVFVAKFSKSGFLVWVKYLYSEGTSTPNVSISDLLIDENGVAYISGGFTGTTANIGGIQIAGLGDNTMMFVSRVEPFGNISWARNCAVVSGSGGSIFANKIKLSESGILLVAGTYSGYQQFRFGPDSTTSEMSTNTFIAGYSLFGTALWGRFITGSLSEYPEDILVSGKSDVYLIGYSNSNPMHIMENAEDNSGGNYDTYILHINSSGGYISHNTLSTQMPTATSKRSVYRIDKDNNIVLATEFHATTLFSNVSTITNPDPGTSDLAFAKLNRTTLEPIWRVHGTGGGQNTLDNTYIDRSGNIAMAGTLYNNITIGGNLITASVLNGAPYLIRIQSKGSVDYTFQKTNGINNYITVGKTALDIFGSTYIVGSFNGPANSLGDQPLTRPLNTGMFIAKYANTKNICGTIYNPQGEIVNEGYVKIFGYTYYQRSPLNDSIPINADGSYCFNNLPLGRYIICAVAKREFELQYVPTYFPSELNWQHANQFSVEMTGTSSGYDIILVDRTPFTGSAALSGKLQQADSNNIYKSTSSVSWKPSQRSTVVLASKRKLKATDDFYAQTETDDYGNFFFNYVPDGYYFVWIEIPGLPSDEYYIHVIDGYFYSSIDFLVDEENIYTTGDPVSIPGTSNINKKNWVYPNPSDNEIIVELSDNEDNSAINIYDIKGSLVYKTQCTSGINEINIIDLAPGTYFIQLISATTIKSQKINIQR